MTNGPKPPAGPAAAWVRAMVGLSVGVAVGLAPYLGTKQVPLFRPLLDLIPRSLQDSTIPVSAALMGLLAAAVQFYGRGDLSQKRLRQAFGWVLALAVGVLIAFMWVQSLYVVRVEADGGRSTASFIVGTHRLPTCSCPATASDAQCINGLSWDESEIAGCWGDGPLRLAGNIVRTSYLTATGLFGLVIGLLVLARSVPRQ